MVAYYIVFTRKGSKIQEGRHVDASSLVYAKRKIERSLKTKIKIVDSHIIGYY